MKVKVKFEKEVDIKYIKVDIYIRDDEDVIPYTFPLRRGDMWSATIDIDNGKILNWPDGEKAHLNVKVCDNGSYYLLDENSDIILSLENEYVPNKILPGSYGDYINIHINEFGTITNWYSSPSISDFEEN